MSAALFTPHLLLAIGAGAALAAAPTRYKREGGTFTGSPDVTITVPSRLACSAKCSAIKSWSCGGFTYHEDGTCQLYKSCNLMPPEVDTEAEHLSYRLLTCPGTVSAPCGCPAGFSRCAGRCLLKLGQTAVYSDAESLCAELGAHLLVPRSEAENQCAFQLRADQWSWLGVTDLASEGVYEGTDGCSAFPATGGWWRPGDPDNWLGAEHCVGMIYYDRWNDRPCNDNNYPLCQLKDCLLPQCP